MTKFKILALDFHNTIYDEVMEYGLAIDAAISLFTVPRETLYAELSAAHAKTGSDWDDDVWQTLPSLKNLDAELIKLAVAARREKSHELVLSGVFPRAVETLQELKKKNIRIYLITEATADIGMQGVEWLGLGGVIDGVYTYPSRHKPIAVKGTYNKAFAASGETHLKKPNPLLLAEVVLDNAKLEGTIPKNVEMADMFEVKQISSFALSEFPATLPMQKDLMAKLVVKDSQYADILQQGLAAVLYVGDSKFKDGIMARNAGVKFALAAYGKKIKAGEEAQFARSKEILYAVTGWDKDTLKLTQEAGKSASINALQPDYVLEESLAEITKLF